MPGDIYNAGQIIDKSLFALKTVPLVYSPGEKPFGYVAAPDFVGKVYSWVQKPDGIYWQFYPASQYGSYYYAKHEQNLFDVKALQEQGALNIEQEREAAENKTKAWYELAADKALKTLAILGGVLVVGGLLIKANKP